MRNLWYISGILIFFLIHISFIDAKENYEDYMVERDRRVKREKPLSEMKTGENEDLLDELRDAVREEIDDSISKERKAKSKKIDKSKLIKSVREIVRDEIEDAIKLKESKYLQSGTFEIGGFLSFQSKGLEADVDDNNYIIKVFPVFNYFIAKNIALGLKGQADFNITTGTQDYYIGLGPLFIFGLDKKEIFCFYASIFIGISMNSRLSNSLGYRYGNEVGIKFILTSGVILNVGVMVAFDNGGDQVTGFQNIIIPTIGITAWF